MYYLLFFLLAGITNFDLLGSFGKMKWLGNFYIVLLYNAIFAFSASLSLFNKLTSRVRQEIISRYVKHLISWEQFGYRCTYNNANNTSFLIYFAGCPVISLHYLPGGSIISKRVGWSYHICMQRDGYNSRITAQLQCKIREFHRLINNWKKIVRIYSNVI